MSATGASPLHDTLVADSVCTITFTGKYPQVAVMIVKNPGSEPVYFRTDGLDPVIGAAGCYVLPAALGEMPADVVKQIVASPNTDAVTQVRLISHGTPQISVRGIR